MECHLNLFSVKHLISHIFLHYFIYNLPSAIKTIPVNSQEQPSAVWDYLIVNSCDLGGCLDIYENEIKALTFWDTNKQNHRLQTSCKQEGVWLPESKETDLAWPTCKIKYS